MPRCSYCGSGHEDASPRCVSCGAPKSGEAVAFFREREDAQSRSGKRFPTWAYVLIAMFAGPFVMPIAFLLLILSFWLAQFFLPMLILLGIGYLFARKFLATGERIRR